MRRIAEEKDIASLISMLHLEREDLLTKAYPDHEERKLVEQRVILIKKRIEELKSSAEGL